MPDAAARMNQQPLQRRIVFSKELADFIKRGRIETKLHIRGTGIRMMIKPRSYAVPGDLPVNALFTATGLFSGWFEVAECRNNTFVTVPHGQSKHAYPLYRCSSGNPQCTAIVFSATSCCDACAACL